MSFDGGRRGAKLSFLFLADTWIPNILLAQASTTKKEKPSRLMWVVQSFLTSSMLNLVQTQGLSTFGNTCFFEDNVVLLL